jgi:hypothetical protein
LKARHCDFTGNTADSGGLAQIRQFVFHRVNFGFKVRQVMFEPLDVFLTGQKNARLLFGMAATTTVTATSASRFLRHLQLLSLNNKRGGLETRFNLD